MMEPAGMGAGRAEVRFRVTAEQSGGGRQAERRAFKSQEHRALQTMAGITAEHPRVSRPIIASAAVLGLVLAGTGALWAYYGTAVFFEMVRTGWQACF